jgi:hypothetical protein
MPLRRFYQLAVACFLTTIGLMVAVLLVSTIGGEEISSFLTNPPFLFRLPLGILGVLSAIGIIALWIGMMWDCVFVSNLPTLSKVKWLILMLLINWLGALIYYRAVFCKRSTPVPVDQVTPLP